MTLPPNDNSLPGNILEILQTQGFDGLGKAIEVLINTAMCIEREQYLKAGLYERNDERINYANGYKPKTVKTRVGELKLSVPQTRDGFYPSTLEKGLRSERALKSALAQMYIEGVSTRKVAAVTEKLCGFSVTSEQVSRANKELDEILTAWRNRPLGQYKYLFLDARYEKVRFGNSVVDAAILIAKGVTLEGRREIIGVSVALSEAELHWRDFFQSLLKRGLHGIEMIISDAHSGLRAARRSVFSGIPWQRCQLHLQQNAQAYVSKKSQRAEVGETIRDILTAPDLEQAQRLLKLAVEKYQSCNAKLAQWMDENVPEGFTVFSQVAKQHRKKLRTSNAIERVNKEVKRRTRVVCIFPNASSCLRLVSAILMEISEDWEGGNRYLNFE